MRKIFISDTSDEAIPVWATVVIQCDGGMMCFESSADADAWENQQ